MTMELSPIFHAAGRKKIYSSFVGNGLPNASFGARGTDGSRSANIRSDNLAFNQCRVYDRRGPDASR
jgi:hypothetical protein